MYEWTHTGRFDVPSATPIIKAPTEDDLIVPIVEGFFMAVQSPAELVQKKCRPCEGGVEPYSNAEAKEQLKRLEGWELSSDGKRIVKSWTAKDFISAIEFFNRCAEVAEEDNHHPDLHLESYRSVRVELWTHAIGGLSENDFILAAKIDQLPIEEKNVRRRDE